MEGSRRDTRMIRRDDPRRTCTKQKQSELEGDLMVIAAMNLQKLCLASLEINRFRIMTSCFSTVEKTSSRGPKSEVGWSYFGELENEREERMRIERRATPQLSGIDEGQIGHRF